MTTTFQRASGRVRANLDSPLPPSVQGLPEVAKEAARHADLAAKVAACREAIVEAGREVAQTVRDDHERAVTAELEGRTPPSKRKTAAAKAKAEQLEAELVVLTDALGRSADKLAATAAPYFEKALEVAEQDEQATLERLGDLADAFDSEVAKLRAIGGEVVWLRARSVDEAQVPVYRPGAPTHTVGQLPGVRSQLDVYLERREAAEAERQRIADWEAEHAGEWARRAAAADRQKEASKVRTGGSHPWALEHVPPATGEAEPADVA